MNSTNENNVNDFVKKTLDTAFSLSPREHADWFRQIKEQTKDRLLKEVDMLKANSEGLFVFVKEHLQ